MFVGFVRVIVFVFWAISKMCNACDNTLSEDSLSTIHEKDLTEYTQYS